VVLVEELEEQDQLSSPMPNKSKTDSLLSLVVNEPVKKVVMLVIELKGDVIEAVHII
jgi:hypothetical protein